MEPVTGNISPETRNAESGFSGKIIAGVAVIAVAVGAVAIFAAPDKDIAPVAGDSMEQKSAGDSMEKIGDSMEKKAAGDSMEKKAEPAATGSYSEYASAKLAMADTGDVVIFFHASWCPACRSADAALSDSAIPAGLTVLKADYDSSSDLKKNYGVTSQHTFVQVDAAGNLVKKWMGSRNVAEILAQVE